ncbi:MAG: Arc family DNA binding domain-containing protein [Verrucomicrobia bacterium]|nr:Arc family DNA binding domain-containing protein [Verrucomicrobiota bacterium]
MEDRKAFLLRINPELWRELEAWAQEELRSVNGQIEYLLKQAVHQRKKAAARAAADSEN